MRFIWILNGAKLKHSLMILVAAVFAVGIVYAEKQDISVFKSQSGPAAIYKVDTDQKKLALTFDISWGDHQITPILETLEEKKVKKATFFLSGEWAEENTELVNKIVEQDYEIGSHGFKHKNYSRLKEEEIKTEIAKADRILHETTGTKPTLLRPPNGDVNKHVLRIAHALHYSVVLWDTDSKDWLRPGVEQIVENVVNKAHAGDIVLLHASDSATETNLALPTIIDRLRSEGYEFVSVTELITDAEIKSNALD